MQIIDYIFSSAPYRGRISEDSFKIGPDFALVSDGATPATTDGPFAVKKPYTDATWCSHFIARHFDDLRHDAAHPERMHIALSNALRTDFNTRSGLDSNTMDPHLHPSATLSYAYQVKDRVYIVQIGDSPVFIQKKNGDIEILEGDSFLLKHDSRLTNMIREARAIHPDLPLKDIRATIKPAKVRHLKNTKDGYGVISLDHPKAHHVRFTSFNINVVQSVLLMTDGLAEIYDTFGKDASPEHFFNSARHEGLRSVVQDLRLLQDNDPECCDFPRLKKGDDVTALLVRPTL